MSDKIQEQPQQEEEGGLSTGTQAAIAAFFLGLPLIATATATLGEPALVLAALGVGGIGLGTKFFIDRNHHGDEDPQDDQSQNERPAPRLAALGRLQSANWRALLSPINEDGTIAKVQEQKPQAQPKDEPGSLNDMETLGDLHQGLREGEPDFSQEHVSSAAAPVRRITISEAVKHVERNSYEVYIGRSLTRPNYPPVKINFFKRHIKLIGASTYGKSSMAAALLTAIMRSHDPEKVMVALLDLEHKTSRLFENAPHVAEILIDDQAIPLVARNEYEVLEHLGYLVELMESRYTLSEQELDDLPLLIAYLEEFIDLKDRFKHRIDAAKTKEEKERAERDYARLVYCIKSLARRGLKVHIQLLMCAQVDYADPDLHEALCNVTSGMAFCVKPTAARAAGFYCSDLLRRNVESNQKGQAVCEMSDCKDLILAPEFPLRELLKKLNVGNVHRSPTQSHPERREALVNRVNMNTVNLVNELEKPVNASENGSECSPIGENAEPHYTQADEAKVLLAWAGLQRSGKPVTRTALMEYLGWNRKTHYSQIIKPVCDKHNIAGRGEE